MSRDSHVDAFPCPTPLPGLSESAGRGEGAESPTGKKVVLENAPPCGPDEAFCAFSAAPSASRARAGRQMADFSPTSF